MKNLIFLSVFIMASILFVACGEDPVPGNVIEETEQVQQTEIPVTQTAEASSWYGRLAKVAPSGTVIDSESPIRGHDEMVTYPFGELPPNGGIHNPRWQRCQVYKRPILTQHAIHSMEHGGVWITYQPELDEETVGNIEELGRGDPFVLISPYPELRSPIVLTAWGLQLEVDSFNDERVDAFIQAFANGIQSPEPGATCTSGVETLAEE